jgi:hypothetical protein
VCASAAQFVACRYTGSLVGRCLRSATPPATTAIIGFLFWLRLSHRKLEHSTPPAGEPPPGEGGKLAGGDGGRG